MTYSVYGLVDPGRGGWVFYIGMSRDPTARVERHILDRNSAAHEYCAHMASEGRRPTVCLFGSFEDRGIALAVEKRLITTIVLTYNRQYFREGVEYFAALRKQEGIDEWPRNRETELLRRLSSLVLPLLSVARRFAGMRNGGA